MGKKDKKGDNSDASSVEEEYVVEKVLDKRTVKGKVRMSGILPTAVLSHEHNYFLKVTGLLLMITAQYSKSDNCSLCTQNPTACPDGPIFNNLSLASSRNMPIQYYCLL